MTYQQTQRQREIAVLRATGASAGFVFASTTGNITNYNSGDHSRNCATLGDVTVRPTRDNELLVYCSPPTRSPHRSVFILLSPLGLLAY